VLLSVPGSHLVDCLDSLLCLWFFHRVIESGGNLLPFVRINLRRRRIPVGSYCL
jgi:hypothetical protein